MLALAIGFPLALFFAWAFEMTPEGIKKEKDVDRSRSITNTTGHKLNYTIIALLVAALGYFIIDKFVLHSHEASDSSVAIEESMPARQSDEHSIAVLPFVDMSATGDNEYFSDGLSDYFGINNGQGASTFSGFSGPGAAAANDSLPFNGGDVCTYISSTRRACARPRQRRARTSGWPVPRPRWSRAP